MRTFAAGFFESYGNESFLDNIDAGGIKHSDDIRLVRTVQTSGNEDFDGLAANTDHPGFMGRSILRIQLHDTCKQDRIHG